MTIIAVDLQPQCRFSCHAANDTLHVHQPEQIVAELNRQAGFARQRLLISNISSTRHTLCGGFEHSSPVSGRHYSIFHSAAGWVNQAEQCRGLHFLPGLPCPADYHHEIETEGDENYSACFHDIGQSRSTGLLEWLFAQNTGTIIIGGLATEHAVRKTACQLKWYGDGWNVIVNLAACRGYTPEGIIHAVYSMRQAGVIVINNSSELPAVIASPAAIVI